MNYIEELNLKFAQRNQQRFVENGWQLQCFYCNHCIPAAEGIPTPAGLMVPEHFCAYLLEFAGEDMPAPGKLVMKKDEKFLTSSIIRKMKKTVMNWQTNFPKNCEDAECLAVANPAVDYCIDCDKFTCKLHNETHKH